MYLDFPFGILNFLLKSLGAIGNGHNKLIHIVAYVFLILKKQNCEVLPASSYNSKISGTYLIFAFSFITTTQFLTFLVAFATLASASTLSLGTLTFARTLEPVDWSVHGSNLHAECYIGNIRQKFECIMSKYDGANLCFVLVLADFI